MPTVENKQYLLDTPLHGVYIPVALLIVGVAIVKTEWTGYAVLCAALLALFKLWRGSKCSILPSETSSLLLTLNRSSGSPLSRLIQRVRPH